VCGGKRAWAAEAISEMIHRRYENVSTIIATNRPIKGWGVLLGDNAATAANLDELSDGDDLHQIEISDIFTDSFSFRDTSTTLVSARF
jgi:hypothetical protein